MLTTIILLAGTWIIEKLKSTFENTLPLAIIIILSICEITLIIFFLTGAIRALRVAFKELDDLVLLVKSSNTLQISKQFFSIIFYQIKNINFKGMPWRAIFKQLGIALLIAIFIVVALVSIININALKAFFLSNVLPSLKNISGFASVTLTALAPLLRILIRAREKSDEKKEAK